MSNRSKFLFGAAATCATIGVVRRPARAAQFVYKYAIDTPIGHPITERAKEMAKAIERDTGGRFVLQVFPGSVLGGAPAMIAEVQSGAVQMTAETGGLMSAVVPTAAIESVPFAWKSSQQVYEALDGELGAYVRREMMDKAGVHVFAHVMENGFREITMSTHPIRNAKDLEGVKLRTPDATLWIDTFHALGASPVSTTLAEAYTALQTHVVDGQENPYGLIELQRFYEVQKYLSVTNHMWAGYWIIMNADAWKALPPDIQKVVDRHVKTYALEERRDNYLLNQSLANKLQQQGMVMNVADTASFKRRLASFYPELKKKFGPAGWSLLEKYAGKLG
ncbi:MAG TPA: TRAP transporter substrate-binding protein [Candidatus Dormibacteraeota bacterium]|nr:TRAP transporter substrate-binding protein [Candidatus Dormibacteraeota bacterium]